MCYTRAKDTVILLRLLMRFAFVITLALMLFVPLYAQEKDALRIFGSTTIQPIMEALQEEYLGDKKIELKIGGGGSEAGLEALKSGGIDVAMLSRNLSEAEKSTFGHLTIGHDGLAIIVSQSKKVDSITTEQLIALYAGDTNNWSLLGCECEEIIVISKHTSRGTLKIFEEYTGLVSPNRKNIKDGAKKIRADAWEAEANINSTLWVAGLKNAIAFVSVGDALRFARVGFPIKMLKVDGIEPNAENIKSKKYPITRELNLLYDKNNQKALEFIEWLKNSRTNEIMANLGFVGAL